MPVTVYCRIYHIVFLILFFMIESVHAVEHRIVPHPKSVESKDVFFEYETGEVHVPLFMKKMLQEEFQYLGAQIQVGNLQKQDLLFIWGDVDIPLLYSRLKGIEDHPDSYVLEVSSSGIGVVAENQTGLFHGVQSVLQLMEQSPGKIPACSILDWPDFEFRGFHTVLRPADAFSLNTVEEMIPVYEWMIRRLARYKYTSLCLSIKGTLSLESVPDIPMGPWTADHVRHLVQFARDRGIEAFPEIKSAGKIFFGLNDTELKPVTHLLEPKTYIGQLDYQAQYHEGYKKRAEALEQEQRALSDMKNVGPGLSTDFKLGHPEVESLLIKIIDEVYDIFEQPAYFHLGVDENFYVGISQDAVDRGPLLAKLINRLATHLKEKGCKVIMFDDMLVNHEQFPFFFEAHGGPPLNTWTAVKTLDRDIIMACWHYGYAVAGHYPDRYPMVEWLANQGFEVIAVPWFKQDNILNLTSEVSRLNGLGVMGSAWAIHRSWYAARGGEVPLNVEDRRELSVFSTTAEAFWAPETANQTISEYDQEVWEKRWLK